jgi:hypothetical protein
VSTGRTRRAEQVLAAVACEVGRVFRSLRRLETDFSDVVARAGGPTRAELASVRPTIFEVLDDHRGLVAGAGVIAAPDLLADAGRWLEWWWSPSPKEIVPLRVNLDPTSPDCFDYTTAAWYVTTARTSAPCVAGPYVDYACTNDYALTVAIPSGSPAGLTGIVAADVLVSNLERRVLPRLRSLGRPMALANAQGRVIASSSPRYAPGNRVPAGGSDPIVLSPSAWRRAGVEPGAMGWTLRDLAALESA